MFFKHKYITQPIVMLADQIIKACQNLTWAIQDLANWREDAHVEALTRLENNFKLQLEHVIILPVV